MSRKFYISLVALMSFSLIGIIFLQGYWIYSSWENKEEEFSLSVKTSLREVSLEVKNRELNDYVNAYQMLIDSIGAPSESNFTDVFLFLDEDQSTNLSTFFAYGILEEDYNISIPDNLSSSLSIDQKVKDYKAVKTTILNKNIFDRRENTLNSSISKIKSVQDIDVFKFEKYKTAFEEYASSLPIHKRTTSREIQVLLDQNFQERNITTPYEFGIYSNGLSTKIKSNNYLEVQSGPKYTITFFDDISSPIKYDLIVSFPEKREYVLSGIIGIASLSFLLTLVIIILSTSALYQILKQKKLSEIKNDFINNISHEFKTPIATINLALDSILSNEKNKITEKTNSYLGMIREENSRMLSQVENILRISQLEKSSNPLKMEDIDLHEVIEDATEHVKLLIGSKKGKINLRLNAINRYIKGNKNHLENIIINILDNAIKYSKKSPLINFTSDTIDDKIQLCIEDRGIGMDKSTQKMIFEKFFREQNGDIHNIKGHGLGLSYVKKIVDFHNGIIKVDSKKGVGTKFSIEFKNI